MQPSLDARDRRSALSRLSRLGQYGDAMALDTHVRQATGADVDSMSEALVRAFADDPVTTYLFRSTKSRDRKSRIMLSSVAKRALVKGAAYTTGDPAKGGAIWMAPGMWRTGGVELL